jgi:hypothetical protein
MNFASLTPFLKYSETILRTPARNCHATRPYWTLPVRADPEHLPLDLKGIKQPRSSHNNSFK